MHGQRRHDPPQLAPCTVLLASSDQRVRAALRAVLEADGRFEVAGEAHAAPRLPALDRALRPAVILLDVLFPAAADGLDAIRRLTRGNRRPVVALSPGSGLRAAALAAGAAAFVEQDAGVDGLLDTLLGVVGQSTPAKSD